MNNCTMNVRTVSIAKEFTAETRNGVNGSFESKTIMFNVACDRNYRVSKTVNGKTTMESPTDFFCVKATGKVAEALNQYCTARHPDGKLVSRQLMLTGSFETYTKPVTETVKLVNVNIGGYVYPELECQITKDRKQFIFVIDNFAFLDKNPVQQATATVATGTVIMPQGQMNAPIPFAGQTAMPATAAQKPVAQSQPAQANNVSQIPAMPVAASQPAPAQVPAQGQGAVPQIPVSATAQPAQTNNTQTPFVPAASVPSNFDVSGDEAPF